jgi:hypothetical protein
MTRKTYKDVKPRLVLLSLLLLYANDTIAFQIDYIIEGGIEYTDNATLTTVDPISSAIRRGYLYADMHHQSETVNYYFRPRISTYNYKNDLLEDSAFYGLDASLSWGIIPRGFIWSFDNYLTQTPIDITGPLTSFNLQTTNVFFTGPDMIFRLGGDKRLEVLLRYANFYYEIGDIDNERYGGLLRLVSQPNRFTEYSINIDSADIRYKETDFNEDYNRNDAYIGINRLTSTTNINFDTGYTQIEREVNQDLYGFIGRIETETRINSRSNFTLYGHAQYTDSSRSFLLSRAHLVEIRTFNTQISGEILYEKYLYAGYSWQYETNGLIFNISKVDQDYEELLDEFDRTVERASVEFNRGITRLTNIYIHGFWGNTFYKQTSIEDKDSNYFIGLDYLLSRSFTLRTRLGYRKRDSTDTTRNYDENSAFISINYSNRR